LGHTYVPLSRSPSSITAAGKVTAGLAESNGSLPPGGCNLRADCLYTGISSGSKARYW